MGLYETVIKRTEQAVVRYQTTGSVDDKTALLALARKTTFDALLQEREAVLSLLSDISESEEMNRQAIDRIRSELKEQTAAGN